MARSILGPRTVATTGGVMLLVGASLIAVAVVSGAASAAGRTLTVSPDTGLKAGQTVVVRGLAFSHQSNGAVLECNNSAGEPATVIQIHGVDHDVGVGCTDPVATTISIRGKLGPTKLTIAVGALGSWETGTDSAGNVSAADSASYPCPPTSVQQSRGDSCVIEFLDNKGQVAIRSVHFKGEKGKGGGPTTTTTIDATTTTVSPTTTLPCASQSVTATTDGASLTLNPGTCLVNGTPMNVGGTGFTADEPGTFIECNSDPGQPTVDVDGSAIPVSCTDPLSSPPGPGIVETSGTGAVGPTTFTVEEGTIGPPCGPSACTGDATTDSNGGNPVTDAATYPCPPTAAQVAAGDLCQITYSDEAGDAVTVPMAFNPNVPSI